MKIQKEMLLADYPPEWPEPLLPEIQAAVRASGVKVVVLDDDPTGNQTVHGVDVLTTRSVAALTAAFEVPEAVVYVLTNSRSVPLARAQALNREIAAHLRAARTATGRDFVVVSRSDSTLRGHYPGETDALRAALGRPFDGTLIVPFFAEGGRVTAGDVHYVTEGDVLIPAAETEYAQDPAFGYAHSNLRAWVSEQHGGAVAPEDVAHVTLDDVRRGGPEAVAARLRPVEAGQVCVVNALTYRDLEVFVAGLLRVEAEGQRFLYRTAASFVRVRGGIAPRPLLTSAAREVGPGGGLIVVGSHVRKTTEQMTRLRALAGVRAVELRVPAVLDPARREDAVAQVVDAASAALAAGEDALVYTSREVVRPAAGDALDVGRRVSSALVQAVRGIPVRPAWMVAKGGITSSDVATDALDVQRARVLGQAVPGVPVWRLGPEGRWPGLVYGVFPGNVGDADALVEMVQVLRGRR
jgi:uncharacterized protein YgbK (DUF1537 family)